MSAAAPPATSALTPTIETGTLLRARYELQILLGHGGMGSVYKARDRYRASLGLPDCHVALKIVSARQAGAGSVKALGREFLNAQRLSHPNVINVYEIDHEGDASFYTMELLEGERLSQLQERLGGALPLPHALAIIRDVGAAIAYAHSRGVVHGDLKPQNVFITHGGQVRVLDFGGGVSLTPDEPWISSLPGASSQEHSAESYRAATPAYASCEQLEGHSAEAADDVYALACIAYELLTNRHPFNGRSSIQARAEGRRPTRPAALRAEAWRALRQGLSLKRAQRRLSIESWLREIGVAAASARLPPSLELKAARPARRYLRGLAACALLLGAGAAVLALEHSGTDWSSALASANSSLQQAWQSVQGLLGAAPPPSSQPPQASVGGAPPAEGASNGAAQMSSAAAGDPDSAPPPPPHASLSSPASAAGTAMPGASSAQAIASSAAPVPAATSMHVAFASASYAVAASAAAARIVIERVGGTHGDIRFDWWTEEASAKADVDYAPLGRRTEYIPSGEDRITVYVPIISNPLREGDTQFYVALGKPGAAPSAEPRARATVTITRGG